MKKSLILGIVLMLVLTAFAMKGMAHTADDPYVTDLITDTDADVGDVSVWNDDDYLYVKFETIDDWYMTETHLHVATSLVGFPSDPNSFDHSTPHDPAVKTYTYSIPLIWDTGVELYIAAHATVVHTIQGCMDVISDTTNTFVGITSGNSGNAVLAWVHPSWNSNLNHNFQNAKWIWESYRVVHPVAGDVVDFYKTFNIPCASAITLSGSIWITCDNGYELYVNNNWVGSAQLGSGWRTSDLTESYVNSQGWQTVEYYITPYLQCGSNQFRIETANEQMNGGTTSSNPAGLIYEAQICYEGIDIEEDAWGGDCYLPVNGGMYFVYTVQKTWKVDIEAEVNDAIAIIFGAGGSDIPGQCIDCDDDCDDGSCASTISYSLSSSAGIINGNGDAWIYGSGGQGVGRMYTIVDAGGDLLFANQDLEAEICQDCAEPFDDYTASSSVTVEDGGMFTFLGQGTGVTGPYTGYYPTTGQILYTTGYAGDDLSDPADGISFDAHLTATKDEETHTIGAYGNNINFNIGLAFQGMEHDDSEMYGYFDGAMMYGPWEGR